MNRRFAGLTATVAILGMCAASSALATNGYYTHGTGTKNKSMAGSGIALPEDSIDIVNNPAVAPFVGDQLVVVNIEIPTRLSGEQRELFEQLASSLGSEVHPQERSFLDWLKETLGG